MTLRCINPEDLPIPEIYSQVVVATGSRLVFVSGQQPEGIHGKVVGHGDFAARRAWRLAISAVRLLLPAPGLRALGVGRNRSWAEEENTFSSRFTRERGLEAPEELDAYRSRRYVAAIVSGAW